jgi:prophage regulatory protein
MDTTNTNTTQRTTAAPKVILRLPAVKGRTGLSRSTIYLLLSRNEFVTKISLGPRAIGFLEKDVEDWISRKVEASQANQQDGR